MQNDEEKIKKIVNSESEIVMIYTDIYPYLMDLSHTDYPKDVLPELNKLDPPEMIKSEKAAAILKAILGSTPEDMFKLDSFYQLGIKDGVYLGEYVRDRLMEFSISYQDFRPYLRMKGQLRSF
jgi:hypothetical protein